MKPTGTWLFLIADRKSTRLNSSHVSISYAVFCLKKKKRTHGCESVGRINSYGIGERDGRCRLAGRGTSGFDYRAGRYAFFFFSDTATTEIYTLSLHDALPI